MNAHITGRVVVALAVLTVAACSSGSSPASSSGAAHGRSSSTASPTPASAAAASPTEEVLPRIALPVAKGSTVEGLVAVHGHDIYARCNGAGSPTVVYFTGWAPDRQKRGVDVIQNVENVDGGRHRICSYERRNTGRSATVSGTQKPEDVLADVDGLLAALGEKGPFVLLGASFGGLISGIYAVAHPDRTAGILLLDAAMPADYLIEKRHHFQGMCLPANRADDALNSLEKVDNCALATWAYQRRAEQPKVPLVYLAAMQDRDPSDVAVDDIRKAYVAGWSPGIWKAVDVPHWMDASNPELVVQYLDKVIALGHRAR